MTTEEPRVVDSGRYGMSDAAKILGVALCGVGYMPGA